MLRVILALALAVAAIIGATPSAPTGYCTAEVDGRTYAVPASTCDIVFTPAYAVSHGTPLN